MRSPGATGSSARRTGGANTSAVVATLVVDTEASRRVEGHQSSPAPSTAGKDLLYWHLTGVGAPRHPPGVLLIVPHSGRAVPPCRHLNPVEAGTLEPKRVASAFIRPSRDSYAKPCVVDRPVRVGWARRRLYVAARSRPRRQHAGAGHEAGAAHGDAHRAARFSLARARRRGRLIG